MGANGISRISSFHKINWELLSFQKNFFSDHTDFSGSLILASYRCDNSGWLNRTQAQWINKLLYSCILGEQGRYSGGNTLLPTKLLCGPGLNFGLVPCVGWGFCWFSPAPRVFSGFSRLPPSTKTNILLFQFKQDTKHGMDLGRVWKLQLKPLN